jgi:hypothetical protein
MDHRRKSGANLFRQQPVKSRLTDAQRAVAKARREWLEEVFLKQVLEAGFDPPLRNYHFYPRRQWAFDFAWKKEMDCFVVPWVAVEIHGGVDTKAYGLRGRHVRGKGFQEDRRKINEAVALGWKVLEFTKEMLDWTRGRGRSGRPESEAIQMLRRVLEE